MIILERISSGVVPLDSLKEFFKPPAVLLMLGVEMPIIYAVTFLIMKIVWKYIEKYMGPKLEVISPHSKKIIFRKNITVSRVIGSASLGIFTLFSASAFASSISIVSVPYKNTSWFNTFNNVLGDIYTFGLASNKKNNQIVSYFLRNINEELAESLIEPLNVKIYGEENKNNTFFSYEKVERMKNYLNLINELAINDEATDAIIKSLISNRVNLSINVLGLDRRLIDSSYDDNDDVVGFDRQEDVNDLSALQGFLNANRLTFTMPNIFIDVMMENLASGITKYEDTIFGKQIVVHKKELENSSSNLKILIEKNKNSHEALKEKIGSRQKILDYLVKISGISYSGDPGMPLEIIFSEDFVSREKPLNGDFKQHVESEKNAKKIFDDAQEIFLNSDDAFKKHTGNELKIVSDRKEVLNAELSSFKKELEIILDEINSKKSSISSKESEIAANKNSIVFNTSTIDSRRELVSKLVNQIASDRMELSGLNSKKNTVEQKIVSLNRDASALRDELRNLDKSDVNYDLNFNKKQNEINSKSREIDDANDELNDIEKSIVNSERNISSNEHSKNSAENDILNLKSHNSSLEKNNTNLNSDIVTIKKILNELEIDFSNKDLEVENMNNKLKLFISNEYNPVLEINNNLLEKKNNNFNFKEKKLSDYILKKNIVDEIITNYSNNIDLLKNINVEIVNTKSVIDVLENVDSVIKIGSSAINWNFADDGSIHYMKIKIKFNEQKVSQVTQIFDRTRDNYQEMKTKFLKMYSKWMRGE